MPGGRTKAEVKDLSSDIAGLRLCENCMKCNEERLKDLRRLEEKQTFAEEIKEVNQVMKEMKTRLERITKSEDMLREQKEQIQELRLKIDSFSKDSIEKLEETRTTSKKWSELFKYKVEVLTSNVKSIQQSVEDTETKIYVAADRQGRINNIVIYNMPENDNNSRTEVKDNVLKLMEDITKMKLEKDISDVFRLGRKSELQKPRPVLVKFENQLVKNLVMENAPKLRRTEATKNIILGNDLSKEDRQECRRLLQEKKEEIRSKDDVSKWIFRIKGKVGDFHVIAFKKQNL